MTLTQSSKEQFLRYAGLLRGKMMVIIVSYFIISLMTSKYILWLLFCLRKALETRAQGARD